MNALSGALCRGQGPLFTSVEVADHAEAAAICNTPCPAFGACRDLAAVEADSPYCGGPVGTWAGELFGTKAKAREHGSERGWGQHRHYREEVCAGCRLAHNEHVRNQAKVAS